MLTKLTVRNFKRLGEVAIELGNPVVFVGPNNSGKTSAMQALALWDIGVKRWIEKRQGKKTPEFRPGVTVNRRDLVAIPVPEANLLWRDLRVRDVRTGDGRQRITSNIRIDIIVEGVTNGRAWSCGLEFDYANEESFYCRPLRLDEGRAGARMAIPSEVESVRVAFLPPLSGLATTETRLDSGAVNVRIGEGRTAEVLRNLCYRIYEAPGDQWQQLVTRMQLLFGVQLTPPRYLTDRGEIVMAYRERGVTLDLSSAGRGLQQTLLLLAYLYANPGAVLLLDEPDAHLEILRQRQTYHLLSEVARGSGCQIVTASHSEVLLNEAADRDTVVAFVGRPHRVDDRGSQVLKALREIGFEHYAQAHETGWALYLGSADELAVLRTFARRIGHDAAIEALACPLVHYVAHQPAAVRRHYLGLREAVPAVRAVALLDRCAGGVPDIPQIRCLTWQRRELANYLCSQATLEAYAAASVEVDLLGPLFSPAEAETRRLAMRDAIDALRGTLAARGRGSPWSADVKAGEEVLTPLLRAYVETLGLPNPMANGAFPELAEHVPEEEIDPEISAKLDAIVQVAAGTHPAASSAADERLAGPAARRRESDGSDAPPAPPDGP